MRHRRVAIVKFLVERSGMTPEEADKMISEEVGPVIFTEGKPADIVSLLQPHIPPDLLMWGNAIREDVREMVGFSRQNMGEAPAGRRTATEMQQVQQAHDIRISEKQDAVADALQSVLRKVVQVVFKMWSVPSIVQTVGYDGAKYWVQLDDKKIVDEYDIKIDVESMTPTSKQSRRQDLMQIIQALGSNPRANIDYLMRLLLQEFEWIDAMKVLPEAPEMQDGPMSTKQFQQSQQQLLSNPAELQQRAGNTAEAVGNALV